MERSHFGGNRARANLALQMALYFNAWLLPVWLLVAVVNLDEKYHRLTGVYQLLTAPVYCLIFFVEIIRLYLGYLGNLGGKIPELASFWLISALIQLPLEVFLLSDGGTLPRLSDISVNSLMTLLLVVEIVTGTIAIKDFADSRAEKFYLAQLYGMQDKSNEQ